jgi:hypothetical protein
VLICIPCLEVHQVQPNTLLALHDPGHLWLPWGCPIHGCGRWFIGPWDLEWHTAAEHPGWTATCQLLRPYPNQRQRVVYRQVEDPARCLDGVDQDQDRRAGLSGVGAETPARPAPHSRPGPR